MAFKTSPAKWKETELDQKIQLEQLQIEKQKIISRRIYMSIWLTLSILLCALGIYGLILGKIEWGVPCIVFGFGSIAVGIEVLAVKAIFKAIIKARRKTN